MSAHRPTDACGKAVNAAARAPSDVLRVVLAYAVFAGLWILLSDALVGWLFSDPAQIVEASTIKGWLFVVVTTLLLYALIRRLREQALAGIQQELVAQTETARALRLLAAIADNSSDAIFAKDREGRYLIANRSVERVVGKTVAQLVGHDDTVLFPLQAETIRANDRRVMDENRTTTYEETVDTVEGERTFLATKGPLHDEQGQVSGMFGISRDITERQQAARHLAESEARREAEMSAALEDQRKGRLAAQNLMDDAVAARGRAEAALAALERLSRLYATLSQSNQSIVRCDSESALFPQICRDAVNFGGLKMAWIGLADETGQQVIPVASFADVTDYLVSALISVDAENPRGQGPTATAIRENRPVWCHDFLHDPRTAPWHERGAHSGWMASAALPLCRNGVAVGAMNLYAGEANFFDDAIQTLLIQMASEISFAMDSYASVAERKRAELKMSEQLDELRRWQQATLGRELAMIELKRQVNALSRELGRAEPFNLDFAAAPGADATMPTAARRA